ncbi:MAG: SAM-dependent methyltransferase [Chloroflexi bacterium]|nr:SAM-dependent methyltransferase [Chloroflexota bacterium]
MPEEKPKSTAEGVAALRAAGAREKDERVRNPDYLAVKFLGLKFYLLSQFPPLVEMVLRSVQKRLPGAYYFHIARTKHIDSVLKERLEEGIDQLVILGAGYDSRPYQFRDLLEGVKVFEVDHPGTQARKRKGVIKLLGSLPHWVTFVPVDFNVERLESKLPPSGYDPSKKTFFIWEGVSMYISPEAVNETLAFVRDRSAPGSSIILEYIYRSVVEGTCDYYGAREAAKYVAKSSESYVFGIEEGTAKEFLGQRGLELVSDFGPEQMEKTYLIKEDGTLHGRVHAYSSVAFATVKAKG